VVHGEWIRDVTGGLYRLSYGLIEKLPLLRSRDMTVHVEILKFVRNLAADVVQYGYEAGLNEKRESRRTGFNQFKLLRKVL